MSNRIQIGLLLNRSYGYERGVLRGIVEYAESRPQWSFSSIDKEQVESQGLKRRGLAGVIASIESLALAKTLSSWRRPVVDVSLVLPSLNFPRVGVDNIRIAQLAAEHFLQRGLRYFGFIGPPDHQYSILRQRAFEEAIGLHGHKVTCYHSPQNRPFDPSARRWNLDRGVQRWLRGLPKPAGVFVPADDWGVQVSEACRRSDVRVPEDVALLGVDDDDLDCELARPRLSSVIVPAERIGYEAAALIDRLLAGEQRPPGPILIPPPGIATRRSTEFLAIEDPEVVTAVRYIREHAHEQLSVNDVLLQVPTTRRTLERRCQQALGWGLGEEIRRAHLELAKRLLARTQLPIATVAWKAGYSDYRYLAVVFRQELKMSPTAYRRQMRGQAPFVD